MKEKLVYYSDELNDEFAGDNIKAKTIDENYKYLHKSPFKLLTHLFWYRMVAYPLAIIYMKLKYHHKVVNRRALKQCKKTGYFIYGNHTHNIGDALIPTLVNKWKDTYVIVHANNVSMPILGKITPSIGAIPLPDNLEATKNFTKCIEYRIKKKCAIMIYPEAHIWPYYTKIRPFKTVSFKYPVQLEVPAFCVTNTYQCYDKNKDKVRLVSYIDGPFFPKDGLSLQEQKHDLRNQVYNCMVERSKNSNIEVIKYKRIDK